MKEQDLSKAHAIMNDDSGYLLDKYKRDEVTEANANRIVIGALLTRNREVEAAAWELVRAQGRMLEKWADGDDSVKAQLWKDLHYKGETLRELLEAD